MRDHPVIDAEFDTSTNENTLPAIINDNIVAVAEAAEKRVQAIRKIKTIALQVTNHHDWTDQNGKPYLQVSGAEKIARLFGISWQLDEPEYQRDEDGHYSYTYKGRFSMQGVCIETFGARSSRDPFFSRRAGKDVPPPEIDRVNVRKAAMTNCLGNGITRLLGIRNMSWEELEGAGIKRDACAGVEYGKTEMSSDAQEQRADIRRMILEMADNDATRAQALLAEHTSFVGRDGKTIQGKRNVNDLSEKAIPVTYGKIKPVYEKWLAEQQPQPAAEDPKAGKGNEPLV